MFALSAFGDITPLKTPFGVLPFGTDRFAMDRLRRWIDVAPERHVLARLDAQGAPVGKPAPITEDREGYDVLLRLLGPPPVPVAMQATGHYWKNLYAAPVAAGHRVALLDPLKTRRFQDGALERTKTDAIDAVGIARFAFEKRPEPTRSHDAAAEALRELVRHRDRIRQDFDDQDFDDLGRSGASPIVRRLHRVEPRGSPGLVDLGFPEFTRYVRGLDAMLATCLLAECPTAHDFAQATPRRLAKPRRVRRTSRFDDGRHPVGAELAQRLVDAATRSVGQHHGPADRMQARHICQDLGLWRKRPAEVERDIDGPLDSHAVGKLPLSIEGSGPRTAARIIAAVGDPARFKSAAAFAAYLGVVPGLKRSGENPGRRAACAPMGNARLRTAPWMPVLGAVRRNPWLRAFYEGLRARGKPPKLAPNSPQTRPRRRHARAAPRRLQRRREPQAVHPRSRCGLKSTLARRDGISYRPA